MGLCNNLQEPTLFVATIYGNIFYGKENATRTKIISVSKASNAHNFFSSLSNVYRTMVGERGVQFWGGKELQLQELS